MKLNTTKRLGVTILAAYLTTSFCHGMAVPDYPRVSYGPEDRQWLNIYEAESETPTPVYIFAHSNGGTADSVSPSMVADLKEIGISTVSWESIPSIRTPSQTLTCWSDAELMLDWVKANAGTYNFDADNLIIGGASRGSIVSWKIAHSQDPAIKGIYMTNALPDPIWLAPNLFYPPDEITPSSPPIYLVYKLTPGFPGDIHDAANGLIIVDKYNELGIGDTAFYVDGISASPNPSVTQFLPEFALYVLEGEPTPAPDLVEDFEGSNTTYTWTENGPWNIDETEGAYLVDVKNGWGPNSNASAYIGNTSWEDYTFTADMMTIDSLNTSWGVFTGRLSFRVTNDQNRYEIKLLGNGRLQLISVVNGTRSVLKSVSTQYSPFDRHTYEADVQGASIKISIDGDVLIDIQNDDHQNGTIGLHAYRCQVGYDDISVISDTGN